MKTKQLAGLVAACLWGSTAAAQDWEFKVTPYVWLPGVSGTLETSSGTIDIGGGNASITDILEGAFIGAIEGRQGKWGFAVDLLWADLLKPVPTPGLLHSSADIEVVGAMVNGFATYRFADRPDAWAEVLAGVRGVSLDVSADLTEGPAADTVHGADLTRFDVTFGVRGRYRFAENWFLHGHVDLGQSTSSDAHSAHALALVGYDINDKWSVQGGYRQVWLKNGTDGTIQETDIRLGGFLVGASFRF